MANPNFLWVRDAVSFTPDIPAPNAGWLDLLWKARTGNTANDGWGALVQGGPAVPGGQLPVARDVLPGPLAPQDITGALVERIISRYQLIFAPTPIITDDGTNNQRVMDLGWYEGIAVTNARSYGLAIEAGTTGRNPGDVAASVTSDWLWWSRKYAAATPTSYPEAAVTGFQRWAVQGEIDTRCSRRLREWDDTLVLGFEPNTGETIDHVAVSWSVLLRTPS